MIGTNFKRRVDGHKARMSDLQIAFTICTVTSQEVSEFAVQSSHMRKLFQDTLVFLTPPKPRVRRDPTAYMDALPSRPSYVLYRREWNIRKLYAMEMVALWPVIYVFASVCRLLWLKEKGPTEKQMPTRVNIDGLASHRPCASMNKTSVSQLYVGICMYFPDFCMERYRQPKC